MIGWLSHVHVWEFVNACHVFPLVGGSPIPYPHTITTERCKVDGCTRKRFTQWLGHVTIEQVKPQALMDAIRVASVEEQ